MEEHLRGYHAFKEAQTRFYAHQSYLDGSLIAEDAEGARAHFDSLERALEAAHSALDAIPADDDITPISVLEMTGYYLGFKQRLETLEKAL